MILRDFLGNILIEMKYQTKLLESLVENQKVSSSNRGGKVMADALFPILNSGILPDGHPAKELLRKTLDKLSKG